MKTITIQTDVYKFNELSEDAKDNVLEKQRDINVDHEWWNYLFEDFKEAGKIIGIDISDIYFSGFHSQGDGACFEGHYEYKKGSVKAIKEFAPNDKELHRIAEGLFEIQRRNFYLLRATVKHRGFYYHKNCTDIDIESGVSGVFDYIYNDYSKDIESLLRDFMQWIYDRLEADYEYLTSDEAIIETIEANDYDFTEYGELC